MKKIIYFAEHNVASDMIADGFEAIAEHVTRAQTIDELVKILIDLRDDPKILVMDMREDRAYSLAIQDAVQGTQARYDFCKSNPVIMISTFGTFTSGLGVVGTVKSIEAMPDQYIEGKASSSFLTRIIQHVMNDENVLTEKRFREVKQVASHAVLDRKQHRRNTI